MTFGAEKLEWCGYLMVKNFEDTFTRLERIIRTWQTPRRTDGRTDGHRATAYVALMHSVARKEGTATMKQAKTPCFDLLWTCCRVHKEFTMSQHVQTLDLLWVRCEFLVGVCCRFATQQAVSGGVWALCKNNPIIFLLLLTPHFIAK